MLKPFTSHSSSLWHGKSFAFLFLDSFRNICWVGFCWCHQVPLRAVLDGKVTVPSDLIFVYDHSCEVGWQRSCSWNLEIFEANNWYFSRVFFPTEELWPRDKMTVLEFEILPVYISVGTPELFPASHVNLQSARRSGFCGWQWSGLAGDPRMAAIGRSQWVSYILWSTGERKMKIMYFFMNLWWFGCTIYVFL